MGKTIIKILNKMIRPWKIEVAILVLLITIGIIKSSESGCGAFLQWIC